MTSDRILKWFITVAASDGVGLNSEQLVMTMSTPRGAVAVRSNSSATAENTQTSNSLRACAMS
jgi:hypothetical protein